MYNPPIHNFDSSNSFKEFKDLIHAWRRYLKVCVRTYFKEHPRLKRVMRTGVTVTIVFIFLGVISYLWLIRTVVYGQEDLALIGTSWWVALLSRLFPWAIGSGLTGIFIRFARTRRRFQGFKRLFDFLVASLGLILLSPFFLIVSLLIKINSPGPALFKQERVGKDGKIFKMWKFRTMRTDAELETGPVWATEEDPRITRVGRFLRKNHIDEIPQLINVFKGEMSLIGPRPERPEFIEEINDHIPNFNERLRVRPGITGLAQVRYRYGASIKDATRKLKYDLLYIKRMCWMLEMRILFWTVGRVLTGEGAR
jgi:exopolysaccharide biosynthesis polyprenyl glycosylphosphotransferase